MSLLSVLKLLLTLAGFIGRQVEKSQMEKAFADALLVAVDKRADAAVAARDDVLAHGMSDVRDDPNNRDNLRSSGPDV